MSDESCDGCSFKGVPLKEYTDGEPKRPLMLCKVCAGTMAGNAAFWPGFYDSMTLRTIAWCTNHIIKELQKAGQP